MSMNCSIWLMMPTPNSGDSRKRRRLPLRPTFRPDFSEALERYAALLAFRRDDPVAMLMGGRCREFMGAPPATDWDHNVPNEIRNRWGVGVR